MKKHLFLVLGIIIMAGIVTAQQPVDEKRLEKAKEKGNVLFESVLGDVDLVAVFKHTSVGGFEKIYWLLKFQNGGVLRHYESEAESSDERINNVWWVGKRYVVYFKRALGVISHVYVERVGEKEGT